jgi:hypothetical protein
VFLRQPARAHPDKGGDAARFRQLHAAFEEMAAATPETRRGLAAEVRAGEEMEEHAAAAEEAATAAAEEAAAVEAAVAAEWQPTWRTVAAALQCASAAYMAVWRRYQDKVYARRAASARRGAYGTVAARRAAQAAERRAARATATAAEAERAVAAMRAAERRTMERVTLARRSQAAGLRELSGQALLEAVAEDKAALREECAVMVPHALLSRHRCARPLTTACCLRPR